MMNRNEMIKAIESKLKELNALAHSRIARYCEELPPVRFNLTGTCAGQHTYRHDGINKAWDHELRFNLDIAKHNWDTFIECTVAHELAHYIDTILRGHIKGESHGRAWKNVMHTLGADDTRTHNFDMTNVKVKRKQRFDYSCECPGRIHELTSVRHNRMLRKQRIYSCRACHAELFPRVDPLSPPKQFSFTPNKKPARPCRAVQKPAPQKTATANPPKAGGMSKADKALMIVSKHISEGRQACIQHIMSECNMSKAGASTYYYNASKKLQGN